MIIDDVHAFRRSIGIWAGQDTWSDDKWLSELQRYVDHMTAQGHFLPGAAVGFNGNFYIRFVPKDDDTRRFNVPFPNTGSATDVGPVDNVNDDWDRAMRGI